MKVSSLFKVDDSNNIVIKDTTDYTNSQNWAFTSYTEANSGTILVLGYHNKNSEIEYTTPIYINENKRNAEYIIKVPKDGWITLYQIVLPNKKCIEEAAYNGLFENLSKEEYVYYLDGNTIKDYNHPNTKVDIDLILLDTNNSNILINEKDYISIWNLQKCLVNLCLEIFNNLGAFGKCFNSSSINDELKYKRDLVWMAIHVIKYLTKYNMKAEAARIINQLEGCNGICTQSQTKSVRGCGCNKGSKA